MREETRAYGNGEVTASTYRFDNTKSAIDTAGKTQLSFAYTFDDNKNILSETGGVSNYGWVSTFDNADRLETWNRGNGTTTRDYNLDAIGNWNKVTKDGVSEDRTHNDVNEIETINGATVTIFDAKGQLTENTNFTFVWDIDGHLQQSTNKNTSEVTDFTYDALGRRVEKKTSGEDTLYVSCGQKVCEEYSKTTGTYEHNRTYVHGTYIDDIIAKSEADDSVLYYHTDRQYNVRGLTDANGDIVELYAYTPYGERTVVDATGTEVFDSAYNNNYGFTGRYLDSETNLWYFRARYYSVEMGRFVSRDPLEYVDGMGLYNGYFAQWMELDPSGEGAWGTTEATLTFPGFVTEPGNAFCETTCYHKGTFKVEIVVTIKKKFKGKDGKMHKRTAANITRTTVHEEKHKKAWEKYKKTWERIYKNMLKKDSGATRCATLKTLWKSFKTKAKANKDKVFERQDAHTDFKGEVQYAIRGNKEVASKKKYGIK